MTASGRGRSLSSSFVFALSARGVERASSEGGAEAFPSDIRPSRFVPASSSVDVVLRSCLDSTGCDCGERLRLLLAAGRQFEPMSFRKA